MYLRNIFHTVIVPVALLSPLFIVGLLLFVSGIPLLEKSANKKWDSDPAYKKYKKEVPILIPSLKAIRKSISSAK